MNIDLPWPLVIFFAFAGVHLVWRIVFAVAKFVSAESGSPEAAAEYGNHDMDMDEEHEEWEDDDPLFDNAGRRFPDSRVGSFAVDIANGDLDPIYLLRLDDEERNEIRSLLETRDLGHLVPDFFDRMRPASPEDYASWLRGYVAKGGKVTHRYDYGLPSYFWVATSGFDLPPEHGASSISLIVPEGIEVTAEDGLGHNHLFVMDGFFQRGSRVPAYADVPA